jgi:hypothetical protein
MADGNHTVQVEARDAANNIGFAEVFFTIDTINPSITITSPTAGATDNKNPILVYSVSEGTVVVTVDGAVVNKVSGNALDTLADGNHRVRVEATDAAGNMTFAEVTFTVDTSAPSVNIISPTGSTTSSTPYLIYFANNGTVVITIDGVVVNKVSGNTLDALAVGIHTVRVEVTGVSGQTASAAIAFTVDADDVDPDDTNSYCKGTANYLVGPSSFTSGIPVPPAGTNAVAIASPSNGETINKPKTIIKGAMDTTVPVMGVIVQVTNASGTATYPVAVNGKYFAAQVPLAINSNTITVIATDQNSAAHQTSISVTGVAPMNTVDLQAMPNAGIMTLKQSGQTTLDVIVSATPSLQNPIANYAWDFNGTGSTELTCYSHATVTASYQQTGLYLTQVAVADTAGNTYDDTVIVNVMDKNTIDTGFKQIWNGIKTALINGNVASAVGYFNSSAQSRYSEIFMALGQNLQSIGQSMQEMYGGQTTPITYYIYFTKDSNGAWALDRF